MRGQEKVVTPEGNPQGKGAVPVLEELSALQCVQPSAKAPERILREFCLSTLVLSARFDFRVVPGHTYYLYRVAQRWQLSLISPEEWRGRQPGRYVAHCQLATDMTWSLVLDEAVSEDADLVSALSQHLEGFVERIRDAKSLEQALPSYEASLPYQQRVMASAMAASLSSTLIVSGLSQKAPEQWLSKALLTQMLLPTD